MCERHIMRSTPWTNYIRFTSVVVLVFTIYLPSLSFEFTNWDDPTYVKNNQAIQTPGWAGLKQVLTRSIPAKHGDYLPVTILSYWIDYQWWGLRPIGYHLTNIVLHAISSGLMFLLLKRLTMRSGVSMVVTLFFALHPMNTEAVSWVAERKSVMAMFWMLLSFHAFLTWQQRAKAHRGYLYLSLLFYLVACLSKTVVVFFPLLVVAYQICLAHIGLRRSLRALVPFFLISLFTGMVRLFGHYASGQMSSKPFETPWVQVLTIFKIFGGYLKTLMIPVNLNNSYPLETSSSLFDPSVLFGLFSMAGMIILAARCLRGYPLVCFGVVWYLAAWLPHAQIIAIPPAFRADRYVYYSSPGLFLALAFGSEQWAIKARQVLATRRLRTMTFALVMLVIGLFTSMTLLRNRVWSDSISLWRDSIKKYPRNILAQSNLGAAYIIKGMVDEAISEYKKILVLKPHDAEAHNNLGAAYFKQGRLDEAIAEYKRAIAIDSNHEKAYYNLGAAYAKKGKLDEAIAEYKKAIALKPHYAEAYNKLATAYFKKGTLDKALSNYNKAIAIKPNLVEAYYKLGSALEAQGKLREAISAYHEAIRIKPDYQAALNNLAWIYATSPNAHIRNGDEAVALASKACELNGFKKTEALDTLAASYAEQGNFSKAVEYQSRAIELASPEIIKELQKRLQLYKLGQAYRDQ